MLRLGRVVLSVSIVLFVAVAAGCGGEVDSSRPDGGVRNDAAIAEDGAIPPGDGGGGVDAGGGAACAMGDRVDTSALALDGVDDHVSMGAAPALGLAELTLEAWVRRDGLGEEMGTGVGGVRVVPIAGKGRGENDGSNVDCNYAFGFAGDVLAADFEDMATGANHPVVGRTAVTWGEWHHVAATYDGSTWRLYLDGVLDAQAAANAMPRADSIQHFGIGTAFDSMGVAAGRLHGAVDEVRVWNRALSEAEIAAGMYRSLSTGEGLVGRWGLDAADGDAAHDSAGDLDGTIAGGAMHVSPGAVLDLGSPPAFGDPTPMHGSVASGASVELTLPITDADDERFVVTYYVREITEADDFSIVVLPDTQIYTIQSRGLSQYFHDQTQWIADNRETYRIRGVIHNGDIVQNGDDFVYEWQVADAAMARLEETFDGYPDGIPYGLGVGNHDQEPIGTTGNTRMFNRYFGVDRFAGRAYYGGHYSTDNDENWITFSAGSLDFVVVSLQYDTTQDPAVTAWARRIFESHPGSFGILNSHYILGGTGSFGAQGQAIYNALRDVDNLQILTCGHISNESRRTDTFEGNVIHSMLADYQGRTNGGNGFLRIWEMSPASNEMTVRTYSPSLDRFETDDNSEFTLEVDLTGAGGDFEELATVDPASGTSSATYAVEPGRIYEWFATVSDCAHTVRTPVYRFTTAP